MLREIVTDVLSAAPDLELVEDLGNADVFVCLGDDEAGCGSLLSQHPRLRLIAIHRDGQQTVLWMMRPHRTTLGELSRDTLLAGVRAEAP